MRPLICKSTAMLEVARRIERAARVDSPVLIWGERGTGKKLVARMIHQRSRRSDGPLVIVATEKRQPPSVEDELFGTSQQAGRLSAAAGGTLVVDEIAGLSLTTQAKLLGASEGRYVAELDGWLEQPVEFRLIATTRKDLAQCVRQGIVREDLYYRLTVVTIRMPSLEERKEDVPSLVQQILGELCTARDRPIPSVEPELVQYVANRPWPNNVGGLRACLDRILLTQDANTLEVDHLCASLPDAGSTSIDRESTEPSDTLADLERAAVMRALKTYEGNRTQAAKALGISVRTLQRKLKHWNV